MRKTETVELTVLCLIEDEKKILLQNRVKKDWQGYALPGGHVEPGESFVDAVIREMKEETGLTVIDPRLAGVKQFPIENGRYIVLLFKATRWSGDLISSDEGQMEWIEYDNLTNIKTVDDFDELITLYKYVNGQAIQKKFKPEPGQKCVNRENIVYCLDFKVTPHQLRHTYITNLIHAGVDPKTVQYLAGHENSQVTMDITRRLSIIGPKSFPRS